MSIKIKRLLRCARCGKNHVNLVFRKLRFPIRKLTHWAPCPNNGQPILLRVVAEKK